MEPDYTLWETHPQGREILKQISQPIVAQVAPEEVQYLDEFADEFIEDPAPPDLSSEDGDVVLGSGLNEILTFASPAVFAMLTVVMSQFIREILTQLGQESIREAVAVFLEWLKKKFTRDGNVPTESSTDQPDPPIPPSITVVINIDNRQQTVMLGADTLQAVIATGKKYGLSEDQATRVAKLIVTQLQSEDNATEAPDQTQ
jgi:hypothetical protein